MIKDATNNEIVIGQKYGYTNTGNGFLEIVIGKAIDIKNKKVVLSDIIIRNGSTTNVSETWETKDSRTNTSLRKRAVYSVRLFPIYSKELLILNSF